MSMSMPSRREYLNDMRLHYRAAKTRADKTKIIDEVVRAVGYHRKYATTVLNQGPVSLKPPVKRNRPLKYLEALPAIELVWEALDYPCAERLHPVLSATAENLASHGELFLTEEICSQLKSISCATLARRLKKWHSPKRTFTRFKPSSRIKTQVPVEVYAWDEDRPGALEIDLVEHNGGSSLGQFAYTLNMVGTFSGYSGRRAVLGKGQKGVLEAIRQLLKSWPFTPWGLHSDSGGEFLNYHLLQFCQEEGLELTRSRPYKKNDNAHVEQKNRQLVREIVGYSRYDSPEEVSWLNEIYGMLDPYANLFLPLRKVIFKERQGSKVKKRYDSAKTPLERLIEKGVLKNTVKDSLLSQHKSLNPLLLHRQLEALLAKGPLSGLPDNVSFKEEVLC